MQELLSPCRLCSNMTGICSNINDLRGVIPRDHGINIYSSPFRYPRVRRMRVSYHSIEITDCYGRVQGFGIEWIKTGFGVPRAIFVCSCGYGTTRLYAWYCTYACKACHGAVHMCQRQKIGRASCRERVEI